MKYQVLFVAAAVLLQAQTPGYAQTADQAPRLQAGPDGDEIVVTGDKAEPEERDEEKKVCRRSVTTGSIMPKVTCRSVAEWEEITAKSIETIEKLKAERDTRQHTQAMREAGGG